MPRDMTFLVSFTGACLLFILGMVMGRSIADRVGMIFGGFLGIVVGITFGVLVIHYGTAQL
ncbi:MULTISPECIES: hypothetical protein [Paenibacillus]|uniref:hypothetical protein n=1 Tax=Paenibacillus TaxID=44249 RepID=UPI0009A5AE87|nr:MULTISPECIES: hypothetical protein [Paenibacillus]SLK16743.1 hypothetical protein SAMN06272722_110237 [Paenibacillus sp. RU5A]SOC74451.1 hypothetical protein SAMN05880581_110237 [Paenibacillus sp. RU26A]SOC76636.1 hypothetical protein SAMN05880586_110237 [Paenibacillus sp. RU5M]